MHLRQNFCQLLSEFQDFWVGPCLLPPALGNAIQTRLKQDDNTQADNTQADQYNGERQASIKEKRKKERRKKTHQRNPHQLTDKSTTWETSETRMAASILKPDPNTQKVQKHAIY